MKGDEMKNERMKPWIVCAGKAGRAVIFGWSEEEPVPGSTCKLYDAKMILWWDGNGGLFGLAASGPWKGSRITSSVEFTLCDVRQVLAVSNKSAEAIDDWPSA